MKNGAEEECRRQGIAFLPLIAETFGGWHAGAEREVKKLGAALARHTGQEEARCNTMHVHTIQCNTLQFTFHYITELYGLEWYYIISSYRVFVLRRSSDLEKIFCGIF